MVSSPFKAALGALAMLTQLGGEAARQLVRPPVMDDYVPPPPELSAPPSPPQQTVPIVQFGLKLPNGNIIWDSSRFCGAPLSTPEERTALLESLRLEAGQLGFDEDSFLAHFGWAKRVGLPTMAWGQPELIPITGEEPQPEPDPHGLPEDSVEVNDESLLPT